MSKKKVIIISVVFLIIVIAALVIIGLHTVNKEEEVKEVDIVQEDSDNQNSDITTNNNKVESQKEKNSKHNSEEIEDVEMNPISEEEYEEALLEERLYENRDYKMSPSNIYKSDDFETIPKDDDWYQNVLSAVSGDSELYKNVESVEVYNLKETKTNFIILKIDGDTYIYQMYKDESSKQLLYDEFDTRSQTKAFIKIIPKKCKKLFSKENPDGLNIGKW